MNSKFTTEYEMIISTFLLKRTSVYCIFFSWLGNDKINENKDLLFTNTLEFRTNNICESMVSKKFTNARINESMNYLITAWYKFDKF